MLLNPVKTIYKVLDQNQNFYNHNEVQNFVYKDNVIRNLVKIYGYKFANVCT